VCTRPATTPDVVVVLLADLLLQGLSQLHQRTGRSSILQILVTIQINHAIWIQIQ
jgi:hypothetical protein